MPQPGTQLRNAATENLACRSPVPSILVAVTWSLAAAPSEHLDHAQYSKLIRDQVATAEAKAAQKRREKGIQLVGRKTILRQHWDGRPGTPEPRRRLSPKIACRNKWARIEALQRNKEFITSVRPFGLSRLLLDNAG